MWAPARGRRRSARRPVPLFDPLPGGGLPVIEIEQPAEPSSIESTNLSAYAFRFGLIAGSRTAFTPAPFRMVATLASALRPIFLPSTASRRRSASVSRTLPPSFSRRIRFSAIR